MGVLDELQAAVRQVAERVGPAVVGVGAGWGPGSGVVVAPGIVLTNAHNLRQDETTVTFPDGRQAPARVAGVDVDGDLAVLTADTVGTTPVEWAAEVPAPGAAVFAVANPGGRGTRVTFGLVSAAGRSFRGPRGRRITGSLEHTAPLAKGSSGGPVVDAEGRLVGINTNRLGEGFYLALPADAELKDRVDALTRGESPTRPRLGVGLAPPRAARQLRRAVGLPDREGLLIRAVDEDGPAGRAGLKTGDLLVEAGGRPLTSVDALHEALDAAAEAGQLALKVVRGTDEFDTTVTFE
jgi:serine protease Do